MCVRYSVIFICFLILGSIYCATKNVKVNRFINIETQIVRISTDVEAEVDNNEYQYIVESNLVNKLAFIEATVKGKKLDIKKLSSKSNGDYYTVYFPKSSDNLRIFNIKTIYTNVLNPRPPEITQAEKQYIKYTGNLLFYSPYISAVQETHVLLPKGEVLAYTETEKPVQKRTNKIIYGPYTNKPENSHVSLDVHFENGAPFLTVTSLVRHIEVSHWGNIAVEESIDMVHCGAKLRGPFSRFEFQRGVGRHASVEFFKTLLPASAKDIYYRDEIGNVSTSAVRDVFDAIEVELHPRFPLFGGWKTQYMLGYNVPAYEYLYRKGNDFVLKMRFVDHIYDNQYVEDMTLKIVLPESVTDVKLKAPFAVDKEYRDTLKTYLDTNGRVVVVVKKSNLVEEHIQEFTIHYRFSMTSLIREPLMVILAFMLVFFAVIIYVRLDFSIYKDEANEIRLRTQAIVDEVQSIQDRRIAVYQAFEDAIARYKVHKDNARLTNDRRKVEVDHKVLTQQLTVLQSKLAECWSEGAEKLNEFQNLDARYRKLIQEGYELANRLIDEKITKQQYQSINEDLSNKKQENLDRMSTIIDNL